MPSIREATDTSLEGYVQADKSSSQAAIPPAQGLEPTLNPYLRCPLPPIFQASSDSLRQYFQGGTVPQNRLLSPATGGISGTGGSSGGNVLITTSTGSGGGSTVIPPIPPLSVNISFTTPVMNPGDVYPGQLTMAKGFQLVSINTDSPARVVLYGNSILQLADIGRPVDGPIPAGGGQGIITDVVLDSTPLQWFFQNRIGCNNDTPQVPVIYITVTNVGPASQPLTVSLVYVPTES